MHRPGRNDPCHCGSGRKYKHCHAAQDEADGRSPRLKLLRGASGPAQQRTLNLPPASDLGRSWEVEIAPIPGALDDDPAARMTAVLVVSDGLVLGVNVESHPPAEPDDIAALLEREIMSAAGNAGCMPDRVSVRHASLVEPLARAFATRGIVVEHAKKLPGIDDALRSLLAHVGGGIMPLHMLHSKPDTWAGWGMPSELIARLFRASAAFHRIAPWKITSEMPVFVTPRAGGHEWACVAMGAAGEQTGLAMYEDAADLDRMFAADEREGPAAVLESIRGTTISLLFNTRAELPKRMREEIQRAQWEIAGPGAWPILLVMHTPGGGIRQTQLEDLVVALESIPRFVRACAKVFSGESDDGADGWTDAENGASLRLENIDDPYDESNAPLLVLEPSGAEGEGAKPLATLAASGAKRHVSDVIARFGGWLFATSRSRTLTAAHVDGHMEIARAFVSTCVYKGAKPIAAVNEIDLRLFLYDSVPRMTAGFRKSGMDALPTLRRFFTFLRVVEKVRCPWARAILADRETLAYRWESFQDLSAEGQIEWQEELTDDLALRVLLLVDDVRGIEWSGNAGTVEIGLYFRARQHWMVWRDEAIRAGVTDPRGVTEIVRERMRVWATTPNAVCGNIAPRDAIALERRQGS